MNKITVIILVLVVLTVIAIIIYEGRSKAPGTASKVSAKTIIEVLSLLAALFAIYMAAKFL